MSIEQWQDRPGTPGNSVALASTGTTQDVAITRLMDWAQSADAAYQVATRLARSSFVPDQFRDKPEELSAAILAGLEVGLAPMAAMRSFDIIQGQAACRAVSLRAIVQSHGHDVVLVESTSQRCRMKGRRRGSADWQWSTWDMDRAQRAKLTSKSNWQNQPTAMLLARATSEVCRLIASDAILGIAYSAEELADGVDPYLQQVDAETTTPAQATGTRRMSRRPRVVAEQVDTHQTPSSPPDEGPWPAGGEPSGEAGEPPAGAPQQETGGEPQRLDTSSKLARRMFAAFGQREMADDERLRFCTWIAERDIATSKDLWTDEAVAIIEALEGGVVMPEGVA